jgi:hypothetical protein|tara:strand:+ start:47 stop:166 length:120 start_codon:yes stop_codon:yes gene_type:complete
MSELKEVMMDLIVTLIYEAKKHKDIIIAMLIGILIGKIM